MHPRRSLAALLILTAVVAVGCGGDGGTTVGPAGAPPVRTPYVSEAEIQGLLERATAVQYAGPRSADALSSDLDPQPVTGLRLSATRSGRGFDLLVFATPAAARAAEPEIRGSTTVRDGGALARAANVVVVFPGDPRSVPAYRAVQEVVDDVRRACAAPSDDDLDEVCFAEVDAQLPSREGTATGDGTEPPPPFSGEEVLEQGEAAVVDDLGYTVVVARQLNPSLAPDRAVLEGVRVDRTGGPALVGLFVQVCNESPEPRRATDDFELVDPFGVRLDPVELAPDNALAYRPARVAPDACLPDDASSADATLAGRALVFRVPVDVRRSSPLALVIRGASGELRRVRIGL